MRNFLFVCGLLSVGSYMLSLACIPCCGPDSDFKPFSVKLAPDAMNEGDKLAFAIVYEDGSMPVLCRSIGVYSYTLYPQTEAERDPLAEWRAQASELLPCPNPLKWGQELGEGWGVLTAPPPSLKPNRRHVIFINTGSTEYESERLEFCAFQDGRLVALSHQGGLATSSTSEREQMDECMEKKWY
jgi:hypothetical protein